MSPLILALSTLNPPYKCSQVEVADKMIDILSLDGEKAEGLRKIYANSSIGFRYSIVEDFLKPRAEWHFWGQNYPQETPRMRRRNDLYKETAPQLAHKASLKAIETWGGHPSDITHVISVSCTGVLAPGLEFQLIESLNLKPSVHRLGINFMGCFGAFKGLQVASAFAREDSSHRILVVCTELCSLHLQSSTDQETLLANSLFSDGAAAAIVGCAARNNENALFAIEKQNSLALEESLDKMTWEAGDHGFFMHLSPYVPALIKRHIHKLTQPLLKQRIDITECDWAIHPGGKSIVQAAERALQLTEEQTRAAWQTLWDYGNMSSATFLFVLKQLLHQNTSKQWAAGVGFGPGLSMEGILLRKMQRHA
jgi:predicted naringenin-chalcone synthase